MKKKEKILTISVASYNAEKYLDKCLLHFIKTEKISKLEILIINDGSTDKTEQIASKYVAMYPDSIFLINKTNGGHGSTINKSIKHATGKYFKIVDADDWVDSKNIDKLISFLEKNNVDLILNPYFNVYDNENLRKEEVKVKNNDNVVYNKKYNFEDVCDTIKLQMHAMTIKTSILKKMGPIITENCFFVDAEYTIFPLKLISNVVFLEYPIYNYLLGTTSQSMNLKNLIKRRNQHLKVCKNILKYYEELKNVDDKVSNLIRDRLSEIIGLQYYIYLNSEIKTACDEIKDFDEYLKESDLQLYEYSLKHIQKVYRSLIIIKILRKFNFKVSFLIVKFYHIMKWRNFSEKV